MRDDTADITADDQIDLWQRLREAMPDTLRAVEEIVEGLPPGQRQVLWELLALVYKRARKRQPMPGEIARLLTPEQRAALGEAPEPDDDLPG